MIRGLSGTLVSVEALLTAGFAARTTDDAKRAQHALRQWHQQLERAAGPSWTARKVFDAAVAPLCSALGLHLLPAASSAAATHALLQAGDATVASVIVIPWGEQLAAAWRTGVLTAIGAGVRWCLCFNGPAVRIFDASRTHSRRYLELDLTEAVTDPATFALAWRLLSASSFLHRGRSILDEAVLASERHRIRVRDSLQSGVQDALGRLTAAFLEAGRRRGRTGHQSLSPTDACHESLVVIYRILFLLFAEARGLVPNWHPVYRDSYTVEALRPAIETGAHARGIWETLQAIARLAHRGCRAGSLRVPPFNGRLFSPAHAPFADSLPLDDRSVREAVLALTTRREGDARRRIAYGDLGVEHLGGVYERVLDFDVSSPTGTSAVLVRTGRRKATGTFYTPRTVTEYLVRRTLGPLVEHAAPDEILRLRIVDPAMGSGAFLVAACRYLAGAYEAALIRHGVLAPMDVTERERASFRRSIAQRCLYGVDLNPMAVQLARLSLWLATLCSDRPLTFFDDQLRTGNSVAGAALDDVTRAVAGSRRRSPPLPLFDTAEIDRAVGGAVRSCLVLRDGPEETLDHIRAKERLFGALNSPEGALGRWRRIVDLWCAGWFQAGARSLSRAAFQCLIDGGILADSVSEPLLRSAADTARRECFFHWRLEFPEVFCDADGERLPGGGFDAVIGNPPWEMLRGDAGSEASRRAGAEAGARLTWFARHSGVYRLQGAGHANLYQLFTERALTIVRKGGRVGLVLPSGFATDHGCAPLRRQLLHATSVDSLVFVENAEALFPIHRGLRFLLITTTSGGRTPVLPLRSGLRTSADFESLPDSGRDPGAVPLPQALLERISGEQLAIPEIRTVTDAAIVSRLVFAHPAAGDEDGWKLRFGRELNATDDRDHFSATADGMLPVVEGKQIRPFQVTLSRSRQFIDIAAASKLLPSGTFTRCRLAYRDVASSTNRLTLISAVLPPGAVTTHTVFCLKTALDEDAQHFLCGMLNSFVANYLVRMRVTTHVTVAIVDRLPLPKPLRDSEDFTTMVALAKQLATTPDDLEIQGAHQALAARLYGVEGKELEHVLSTFPLVDRALRESAIRHFLRTL